VDTILVILPDFTWPSKDFIAHYASHVPGVLALAKFGISVSMTQETLEWLKTKSQLLLPKRLSLSVSDVVAATLISRNRGLCEYSSHHGVETSKVAIEKAPEEASRPHPRSISKMLFQRQTLSNHRGGETRANHVVRELVDAAALPQCNVVAIVDRGNWDGVCVALLVKEMLVPRLSTAMTKVPHVLTEEDSIPPGTQCALVICTNGCFHSASFARHVLEAEETGVFFIPIVGEENFHFPTDTLYEEVRERAPSILKSQKHRHTQKDRTADNFVAAIETIFREIAVAVVLQDSEDIIAVRVGVIAGRLKRSTSLRHQASLKPGRSRLFGSRGVRSSSSSSGNLDQSNQLSTLVETTTVDVSAVNACSTIHEASQSVSTSAPPPAEPWEEDTDI